MPNRPRSKARNVAQKILHGIRWRIPYYISDIKSYVAKIKIAVRWRLRAVATSHQLPAPLILSFTSYPPRYRTLALTVQCLLRQSVKPDRVILWIADADYPSLPANVIRLQKEGLEIRKTKDFRSYKKILPALDAFPAAFICTADDDVYYHHTWLQELVDRAEAHGPSIVCHRAYKIVADQNGKWRPYSEWHLLEDGEKGNPGEIFPTGVGGVLYGPNTLKHELMAREIAQKLCPDADDVWLFWVGRKNKAHYKNVPYTFKLVTWTSSQKVALWQKNVGDGGNDKQIQSMLDFYGSF